MPRPRKTLNIAQDHTPQTEEEKAKEAALQGPQPLDVTKPLCTRKNPLKFIAKSDGKLLCQAIGTGSIVVTDLYGCIAGKQRIYNGAPGDYRTGRQLNVHPGESVFVVRQMTAGRKVWAGRVVSVEPNRNIVVDLFDRDFFPMTSRRRFGDTGYGVFPANMVYKTPGEIEAYANGILSDLKIAQKDIRQEVENHLHAKKA